MKKINYDDDLPMYDGIIADIGKICNKIKKGHKNIKNCQLVVNEK